MIGKPRPNICAVPLAALVLVAALLAACGGGRPPASVADLGTGAQTTSTAAASSPVGPGLHQLYQDAVAYVGCMHSHGDPTYPSPQLINNAQQQKVGIGNEPGATRGARYRAANKACDYLLPSPSGGPTQAQVQQALANDLRFSKCMRSHGVPDFPDPVATRQGIGFDPNSRQFQQALKSCRSLAPGH